MRAPRRRRSDALSPRARPAALLAAALLAALPARAQDGPLVGHGGPVMDVAVSPSGLVATASFDNSVGLWEDGAPRWLEGHTAAVDAVAFTGDGRIVSGGDDFAVRLWDPASGASRVIGRHRGKVADLAVSDALVASAGWDGAVGLWPLGGGEGRTLAGHDGAVNAVAFLGDALATGSADGTVRLWDVGAGRETGRPVGGGFPVTALAAGGGWLAYGAADGTARVIDPATGETLAVLDAPGSPVLALATSADGRLLAMGGGDGRVIVVETGAWEVVRAFQGAATGPIWALAFAGDRLLGAGTDARVSGLGARGRAGTPGCRLCGDAGEQRGAAVPPQMRRLPHADVGGGAPRRPAARRRHRAAGGHRGGLPLLRRAAGIGGDVGRGRRGRLVRPGPGRLSSRHDHADAADRRPGRSARPDRLPRRASGGGLRGDDMKAMLLAAAALVVISVGAWLALGSLDFTIEDRTTTDAVRL